MSVSLTDQTGCLHQEEDARTNVYSESSYPHQQCYYAESRSVSEIEEEKSSDLFEINHVVPLESIKEDIEGSLFSFDVCGDHQKDCVYVGVGNSESSMDTLSWTLKNAIIDSNTMVFLIHIFPEIHHIPSPLGRLPKSQVSARQLENYMAQERDKRRELLQKLINMCSASKVKVDTILVESDAVGKAMVDLITVLNMRKLILGTSKSKLRKLRSKRGNGIADQVIEKAPEFCDVKIICDGKEVVIDQMVGSPLTLANPSEKSFTLQDESNTNNDSFACMCFKSPKVK
ncbi:PREDICTED: U-box domain-containing protein 35-like [Populus euphratica]|uniref:U-box domain-containing protein 35-like n=1 Tax=Populus euphratica TaxID=75702 RepID=A0AAJ6T6S0_POPEU|nr:PREDICTED: U-box domain-containing protein 35-like [Populus euphratica]